MTEHTGNAPYDDEIDLREVIQMLLDGWRWIVGATIAGAVLALAVTLVPHRQPQYSSSANVVLTKPDVVFNLNPQASTQINVPPSEGLAGLLTSNSLMAEVLDQAKGQAGASQEVTIGSFKRDASASVVGTVLTLTVKTTSSEGSTLLANTWAEVAAQRINQVYSPASSDARRYASQARDALEKWQQAQQALVKFQSTNREGLLADRLASMHDELRRNLSAQQTLELAIQDANSLMTRLGTGRANPDVRDDLVAFTLALRSVTSSSPTQVQAAAQSGGGNSTDPGSSTGPVILQAGVPSADYQLQVDASTLLSKSTNDQIAYLSGLVSSMKAQQGRLGQVASELEGSIPKVQGELAKAQEARKILEVQRDMAASAYRALSSKAQESALASIGDRGVARVVGTAVASESHPSSNWALDAALVSAFCFGIASLAVLALSWWRSPPEGTATL